MFRAALTILINNISEVEQAVKALYGPHKKGILHTKVVKIEILLLQTRQWALALASQAEELEQRVKVLEEELEESRLK